MSLINDALKKAGQDAGGGGELENAYPQKILFLASRQSNHRWVILVAGLVVLGAVAVMKLPLPSLTQHLFRFGGVAPPHAVPKPRLPTGGAAPVRPGTLSVAGDASKAQAGRRAQVDELIAAGTTALQAGNAAAARAAFTKAIKLDETSAVAHDGLGLAEKLDGKLADAERQYQEAIRLNASSAEAHNNLALLYDQQSKTDRAIVEYTTALSLRPDYAEARLNYAIALERVGRTADARVEYERFLSHAPPELHDVAEQVRAHLLQLL